MANRRAYYVGDGEVTSGPFSLRELRVFLAHRTGIDDRFLVRRSDEQAWQSATDLPEFAELFVEPVPHSTMPASPRAKRRAG